MSIFGNTYGGVPSPLVFHEHPYPTRYHGMNLTVPRFDLPYVEQPYAVAPYAGVGTASPDGIGSAASVAGVVVGGLGGAIMGVVPGAIIGGLVATKDPARGLAYGALAGAAVGALLLGGLFAATAKPVAGASGLGGSCGCSGVSKAGGTKADLSSLGGGVFR